MRYLFLVGSLVLFCTSVFGETIFLYLVSIPDDQIWQVFLKSLRKEGLDPVPQKGTRELEDHLRIVSNINSGKKGLFVAIDIKREKNTKILVGVFAPKKPEGKIKSIEEIPYAYYDTSYKIAESIAMAYGKKVLKAPFFPLLGVDMPALYIKLRFKEGDIGPFVSVMKDGIKRYLMED